MAKTQNVDWKKQVKVEQDYICLVCGKKGTDRTLDVHHKIPRSRNGTNVRGNLVAWHKLCHQEYHKKYGNRISDDFGNPI